MEPRPAQDFQRAPFQFVSPAAALLLGLGRRSFIVRFFAVSSSSAASVPVSHPGTSRPLSLGVIFLTLYIDLIGFSIAFPLAPRMLEYYLAKESGGGPLAWLLQHIQALAPANSTNPIFVAALFGGVVSGLYGFLQFLFAPIWGSRSDRLGRRPVLLMTVAGNTFSYLLWAFSGSFALFVLSRLIGGAASGNLSVATAAVADVTTRENRAKGMGIVGAAFGLGFITGPAIGGIIGERPVSTAAAALGLNPFSLVAFIAMGFSALNLIWITLRFRETLTDENRQQARARTRNPIAGLLSLGDSATRRANLVYFLYALVFSAFEATLSFLAAERLQNSTMDNHSAERQLAYVFVFIGFVSIVTQGGLVRRIIPKIGERAGAVGGFILIALGFAGLAIAQTKGYLYGALVLVGVGSGFANTSLSSLVSLYSGSDEQGQALGIYRSLGSLSRALGPLWAGIVFFRFHSESTYFTIASLMLVPFLLGLMLPKPQK